LTPGSPLPPSSLAGTRRFWRFYSFGLGILAMFGQSCWQLRGSYVCVWSLAVCAVVPGPTEGGGPIRGGCQKENACPDWHVAKSARTTTQSGRDFGLTVLRDCALGGILHADTVVNWWRISGTTALGLDVPAIRRQPAFARALGPCRRSSTLPIGIKAT
jgi:hypothetical protein